MKQAFSFFVTVLSVSIILFAVWGAVARLYGALLDLLLWMFYQGYSALEKNDVFPYLSSLEIIPLFSLLVCTKGIGLGRKLIFSLGGFFTTMLLDFFYIIMAIGQDVGVEYLLYRSVKWVIPFVFYLLAAQGVFMEQFSKAITSDHRGG